MILMWKVSLHLVRLHTAYLNYNYFIESIIETCKRWHNLIYYLYY